VFEPLGPSTITCTITDVGAGCTFTTSVFVDWSDEYFCGGTVRKPNLKVCHSGASTCLTKSQAKAAIKAGTAVLGNCPTPKNTSSAKFEEIKLYPNPTNAIINVASTFDYSSDATIDVIDLNGKLLQSSNVNITEGVFEYTLNVSNLTSGMYMIRISTNREVIVERFQVVK
jgi:hypothetical protein